MKKIFALLLATLMLLSACGPAAGNDTTAPTTDGPTVTDEPSVTDPVVTEPPVTEPTATEPAATEPPEPVERIDYSIEVKEDTYVNDGTNKETNFGSSTEIFVKTHPGLTRYGYLKFDISSLKGDTDFTCIELELTLASREVRSEAPTAVLEIYGVDLDWNENELNYVNQPEVFSLICKNDKITSEKLSKYTFPITDYLRQAVANGQTEIALYMRDATPQAPLHLRWVSKEAGANAPQISVYYGTKTDDTKYEGATASKEIEISKTGIDNIIGWNEVEDETVPVLEDTYVEGDSCSNQNFGSSDVIQNKALPGDGRTVHHRISLFKFDISSIKKENLYSVKLGLQVQSVQDASKTSLINVYGCDPYAWEENAVTYNNLRGREDLITTYGLKGKNTHYIDITDYVKQAMDYGDEVIALWLDADPSTAYRVTMYSSESTEGKAPHLEVSYGGSAFATKIKYKGENPWDVAMEAVSTWFNRWEIIKTNGRDDAELIVKDPDEYSIVVDAVRSANLNGENTKFTQYPTRNVSTLKGYKANTAETAKYDIYGGLMDESMKQEATGYFYIKKIGDRLWAIDPLGYPFYRASIVSVSSGGSPRQKEAVLAKYGSVENWADATNARLFELGLNSVGGWSEIATLIKSENPVSQTRIFNVGVKYGSSIGVSVSSGGTRLPEADVIPAFDPGFATFADSHIKEQVTPYVGNPHVYGWMSDNELSDTIMMLDHALALDHTDMRRVYTYATAWTFMYLKTGKKDVSMSDVNDDLRAEYLAMTYDKYFEVVTNALKKYDPDHMYMGCRFVNSNYRREMLMRVAGYWCDVVTFNYYNVWEGEPEFMRNAQNWLGDTPFVVTEWYTKGLDVTEKDPLMLNKTGAGWCVRNQTERGKSYQNYALMLMECKGCVGFDWFKYWDNDPLDTTADPSNIDSNKGTYATNGEEYTDLTKYIQELNTQKYNVIKFFDAR